MPKVSVVIPSFNHEKYVRASIESVLAQSFQDFEIVVTDDGSHDRTPEIVSAIDDHRVSLTVLPRNCGVSVAVNASIKRATGEYIAHLSSDDLFLAGKLDKQVRFLDQNPNVGAVFTWPAFVDQNGVPIVNANLRENILVRTTNQPRHAWLRRFFFDSNALCAPTAMIRRTCFDKLGLYNPALAQLADFEMWVRLLLRYEIHLIEEPLVAYRILTGQVNASAARPDAIVRDQWEWRKVLDQYLLTDDALLLKVFPELTGYDGSRAKTGFVRQLALKLLQRYLHQEAAPTAAQKNALPDTDPRRSLKWGLADLALRDGRPAHVLFALDTMYSLLSQSGDETISREFIRHTGSYDTFGSLANLPWNRRIGP